MFGSGKQRHQQ